MRRMDLDGSKPNFGGLRPRERRKILDDTLRGRSKADMDCAVSPVRQGPALLPLHDGYIATVRMNLRKESVEVFITPTLDGEMRPEKILVFEVDSQGRVENVILGAANKGPAKSIFHRASQKEDGEAACALVDDILVEMKTAEPAATNFLGVTGDERYRLDEEYIRRVFTK